MASITECTQASREDYWREQIRVCEQSGTSIAQYCRDMGISVSSYHWWKGALKRRGVSRAPSSVFTEVRVALPAGSAPALIEVALGEERRVRVWPGFDADTLAGVVRVLEAVSC